METGLHSAKGGNRHTLNKLLLNLPILLPIMVTGLCLSSVVSAEQGQPSARCKNAIARVVTDGDQNFRAGDLLCPEDWVRPLPGQQPKVVCRKTKRILAGPTGRVKDFCTGQPRGAFVRKGAREVMILNARGNEGNPSLMQPFGSVLMQKRPDLTWKPTQGASHYWVRIDGYGFKHEQMVSGTQLRYPSAWPDLQYGDVYNITIFAYQGDRIMGADRTTVSLLFEKDVAVIQAYVAAIQQLPFSLQEVAPDLDAVYMSQNLLNQSIQLLESIRKKGQSTPQLNQLLAQRYAQAGWPDLAKLIAKEPQPRTKIKFPQK